MKAWKDSKFFHLSDIVYRENQDRFLAMITENPVAKLLDIGCNDGEFTMRIARRLKTNKVYGIEIDPSKARLAIEKGICVKISDVNRPLPFDNNFFDVITANQVIEHLYDQDIFFKEVYRLLRERGGKALISTLNLCSWHNIIFMLLGMQPPGMHLCPVQVGNFLYGIETHGHIKLVSLKALRDIAKYYGFKVERATGSGYYPFLRPISTLFSHLDKSHAVYSTICILKK